MARKNILPRRPWATQNNGDLWEMFYDILLAKGPETYRGTKVKGHATEEAVKKGLVEMIDKAGNDMADKYADEGVELHGKDVLHVSRRLTARHMQYTKLCAEIHDRIVAAFQTREALLKADKNYGTEHQPGHEKGASTRRLVQYYPVSYARDGPQHIRLKFKDDIANYRRTIGIYPEAQDIQRFLQEIKLQAVDGSEQGVSWLELYVLFNLHGYGMKEQKGHSRAESRRTLKCQFKRFIMAIRAINRHTADEQSALFFRHHEGKMPRLRGLGISSHVPMVRFQVQLPKEMKDAIAFEIIRSQTRHSRLKVQEILDGKIKVQTKKLNLRSRANWAKTIRSVAGYDTKQRPADTSAVASDGAQVEHGLQRQTVVHANEMNISAEVLFRCPACQQKVQGDIKALDLKDLGNRTRCKHCNKAWPVSEWKCPCDKRWHDCPMHRHYPEHHRKVRLRGRDEERNRNTVARRMPEEGSAKARKTEVVFSAVEERRVYASIQPRFLSRGLKRKFKHLLEGEKSE